MIAPELLAPAGTLKNLSYALAYGADAVYAGMPRYSLRVRENEFSKLEKLSEGINETHRQNKKFFLACNVLPHNAKVRTFLDDIKPVVELGPDALIMADPGLIMMVREHWPDMPVHLSVQSNVVNYATVKFWQTIGIERIILSRELSLDEIAEIKQQCPEMELEVFVHGSLCIAYSGRCLLSGYFNHRDANQGSCTNSCRWEYNVNEAETDVSGDIKLKDLTASQTGNGVRQEKSDKVYLIEEKGRPGEFMPIEEDEHGTYIMNSKDLRAVEHVERLVKIGVNSLKIEGRTKSYYYAARSAQVYRRAIDEAVSGKPFDPKLILMLDNLANRGYTDGFFQRHNSHDYQNYVDTRSESSKQLFVGEVVNYESETGLAEIEVKNKFHVGDKLELILPGGNESFTLDHIEDIKGNAMDVVPGGGYRVKIRLNNHDCRLGLLARNI